MYEGEVRRCYGMQRPTTSANIVEWELLLKFVPGDVQYQAASAESMRSTTNCMFSHEGSEAECLIRTTPATSPHPDRQGGAILSFTPWIMMQDNHKR